MNFQHGLKAKVAVYSPLCTDHPDKTLYTVCTHSNKFVTVPATLKKTRTQSADL